MMKRQWLVAALAVLIGSPAWAPAQEPPRPRRPPRVERAPFAFSFSGHRGRIGVVVNTTANSEADRHGAKIEAVTPGGPADRAGLKAGDIIAKFNETPLAGATGEGGEWGPGMKLIELAHELDPGDTVQVEYRRGNDTRRATLVAEALESGWSLGMPPMPGRELMIDPDIRLRLHEEAPGFSFSFGGPWGDLDLVSLNPDLGEYFGTREGVLVVKAPGDSALPLKGGDVILSIGGRKPSSPSHAMRILRSYETGETVAIDIVRKQKRTSITWTVPEREDRIFRRYRHRERERDRDRDEDEEEPA